ncbi:MAG: hypothetical protein NTW46_00160 [Candidatus Nealsonbacteria bacterium]|nr:hypothetical protein [Candidatus Nealsonbacteria bacterium]
MTVLNQNLTRERWFELPFFSQMANLGSEVSRAIKWKDKDPERSKYAFESALELLDLTIEDEKNREKAKLSELCRLREVLADYFCFDNIYGSSDDKWNSYFYAFNYAANLNPNV